ncbi:MAG: MarR family transcriptional regulator [Pseudomonadota bacterium]|nr:MarR family transcriptional regulator [Pseudomonadota bacterium]
MTETGSADGRPRRVEPQRFRIGFLLHDVSRMRRTLFDQEMRPLGITRSQWWVLAQLSRSIGSGAEEGMLQTELARIVDMGKAPMTGLIDRLEASGFVERRPDRHDRRAKRVVITAKGHQVLDRMAAVGERLNGTILAGISDAELGAAEAVLARIKDNIRGMLDASD